MKADNAGEKARWLEALRFWIPQLGEPLRVKPLRKTGVSIGIQLGPSSGDVRADEFVFVDRDGRRDALDHRHRHGRSDESARLALSQPLPHSDSNHNSQPPPISMTQSSPSPQTKY